MKMVFSIPRFNAIQKIIYIAFLNVWNRKLGFSKVIVIQTNKYDDNIVRVTKTTVVGYITMAEIL